MLFLKVIIVISVTLMMVTLPLLVTLAECAEKTNKTGILKLSKGKFHQQSYVPILDG